MKTRIISATLAFLLMLAMLPAAALAADTYTADMMHAAPTFSTCTALKADGTLWGWGDIYCLTGEGGNDVLPTGPILLLNNVVQSQSTGRGWMALKKDGTLWSAGTDFESNLSGLPIDYTFTEKPLTMVMDKVAAFSLDFMNTMVIRTDGSLWCWGDNGSGQIGNGTLSNYGKWQATPVKIMDDVIYASAGFSSFAITSDGTLYGWGSNESSKLGFTGGNSTSTDGRNASCQATPKQIATDVAVVSASSGVTAILKKGGSLWTCGYNVAGYTGHSTSTYPENVPVFTKLMDGVALPEGMVSSGTQPAPPPTPVQTASESVAQSTRPVTIFTDEQGRVNRFNIDGYRIENSTTGEIKDDRIITITTFSEDYKPLSTHILPIELTYIGGLFVGEDYNFMVYYDYNLEEKNSVEVLRVVKYSKDWTRLGQVSITGGEIRSYGMAYGGNFSFAEYNGMLYIHTAQSMFKWKDGLNHQANVTVSIRVSDMVMTDSNHEVISNLRGYVSHSRGQDIMVDARGNIITLDNGDAYPNGAYLFRYKLPGGADKFVGGDGDGALIKAWPAGVDWYTGSDTQGLVETGSGYLSAYLDSGKGTSFDWQVHPVNAYIAFTPRDNFTAASTKTYSVTSFTTSTNESVYSMQLVPVNMDGGYVIVITYDRSIIDSSDRGYRMYWAKYSANGSVTALTRFNTDDISWGNVLYTNNQLVWLEYNYTSRQNLYVPEEIISNFYTFDGTTLTYHAEKTDSVPDATAFTDVPGTHWSYEYVKKAASNNLVQGVGDGRYEPERNVSNAEFATMAVNLFYKTDNGRSGNYWWSANMDIAGTQRNIFAGTAVAANGTSSWDATKVQSGIDRFDMAQVIYNIAREQGWSMPDTSSASSKIADWSGIPANYREAVAYCFSAGFVTGVDSKGTFSGESTMTRAQAAAVLCRLLDAKNAHN